LPRFARALSDPNSAAIVSGRMSISYSGLDTLVFNTAGKMLSAGITRNKRVAISGEKTAPLTLLPSLLYGGSGRRMPHQQQISRSNTFFLY